MVGVVRWHVLANISAITQFMPGLVKSFMTAYPLINISLEEQQSLAITKAVAENRAEIGIFTRLPHGADIEVFPFRSDRLVLLVPDDHPLAARSRSASQKPWIMNASPCAVALT